MSACEKRDSNGSSISRCDKLFSVVDAASTAATATRGDGTHSAARGRAPATNRRRRALDSNERAAFIILRAAPSPQRVLRSSICRVSFDSPLEKTTDVSERRGTRLPEYILKIKIPLPSGRIVARMTTILLRLFSKITIPALSRHSAPF